MRAIRFGLPALTGLVLLYIATQDLAGRLQEPGTTLVDAVHASMPPIGGAVLLLLSAIAIGRQSRSGYLLGIAVAIAMVVGGGALIVFSLPYLADGGLGAAISAGVMTVAGVWIVVWLGYGFLVRRARSAFAATWQPVDLRLGIVMGGLTAFAAVAYLGLGFVLTDAATANGAAAADAEALVAGTTIEARVIDATFEPAASGAAGPALSALSLELTFTSGRAYDLAVAPSVCLTDAATANDPAFKPDTFCWGTGGPALAVPDGFQDLAMPASPRRIRLDLTGAPSRCAFGAGSWVAQVQITPRVGDAASPPQGLPLSTTFIVGTSIPAGGQPTGSSCIASAVSP